MPCRSEIQSVPLGDVGRRGVKINVGTAGGLGGGYRVGGFVVLEQTGKFEFGGGLVPECGHPLAHREDGVVEICAHRTGEDDAQDRLVFRDERGQGRTSGLAEKEASVGVDRGMFFEKRECGALGAKGGIVADDGARQNTGFRSGPIR